MSYGRISEAFWHDDVIRALTEPARHFMLYLMSCPHGNRLGLFVLAASYAAEDLDCDPEYPWDRTKVIRVLEELREKGRIGWDRPNRVVFVRYYLRHNVLYNGSVVKGALNDLSGLPKTDLLGDLLETVIGEQIGDAGQPIRLYYAELEDELRRRCRIAGIKGHNGVDADESHSAPHGVGHGAGHGATHSRARAALPSLPLPSLTSPDLTHPTPPDRGEHGKEQGEDVDDLKKQIAKSLPAARRNIVAIHGGSRDDVEIEGHRVGVGIEIKAYRKLCETRSDPPHIIAAAIAHIPAVSELEPPVSLARWTAKDGNPIYEQCVGLAYKGQEAAT